MIVKGVNAHKPILNPLKQLHNAASNAEIYSYKRDSAN